MCKILQCLTEAGVTLWASKEEGIAISFLLLRKQTKAISGFLKVCSAFARCVIRKEQFHHQDLIPPESGTVGCCLVVFQRTLIMSYFDL